MELFLENNKLFTKKQLLFSTVQTFSHRHFTSDSLLEKKFLEQNFNFKKYKIIPDEIENTNFKILLLTPRDYRGYPNQVFQDFSRHLDDTGRQYTWIDVQSDAAAAEFSQELRRVTPQSKILLFVEPLATPEVFPQEWSSLKDLITKARQSHQNLRVVSWLGDIWREKDFVASTAFSEDADLFIHMDNLAISRFPNSFQNKSWFFPFASFDQGIFAPSTKNQNVFFSGQIRDSDRRFWIRLASKQLRRTDINFELNVWEKWTLGGLNLNDYANRLNTSFACLSLTQRGKEHWIIPARAIQALQSGCLLIQQEGVGKSPLSEFLNPGKHYLPFTNPIELNAIFQLIQNDPNLALNIALDGSNRIRELFTNSYFWRKCSNLFN